MPTDDRERGTIFKKSNAFGLSFHNQLCVSTGHCKCNEQSSYAKRVTVRMSTVSRYQTVWKMMQ